MDEDKVVVRRLLALPVAERGHALRMMEPGEAQSLDRDWGSWAHDGQRWPDGDWRTWVMMAGRGFGKTRAGAEWVFDLIRGETVVGGDSGTSPPKHIALIAATVDEARRVMVEGRSGLLAVAGEWVETWSPTRRLLRFVDGSEAVLFSGASPEGLRGPEHHLAWCDELAKWDKVEATWDNLQLGLRLGARPRALVTTTPRPGEALERIMAGKDCVVTGGPMRANPHLPDRFRDDAEAMYGGTRQGRQELEGEYLRDAAGALWTREVLEGCRVHGGPSTSSGGAVLHRRFVIGVDPPAGDGTCGIILCAIDRDGVGHVLSDHSIGAVSPGAWAARVAAVASLNPETLVVAEVNQGGAMVEAVLRGADPGLRIKLVRASVGKSARAEPVALLFEQGKVRLHGRFDALEAELRGMVAGGGYHGPGPSPDRADAMVWALSELMVAPRPEPRVVRF